MFVSVLDRPVPAEVTASESARTIQDSSIARVLRVAQPYLYLTPAIALLVVWTALVLAWHAFGIPFGPG